MDCIHKKDFKNYILLLFTFFSGIYFSFAQCPTTDDLTPSFCDTESPTIGSLQATDNGSGFAWFASAGSTTPLASGIGLVNGENYFLDNSAGNCGTRIEVVVSLFTAPTGQNFQGVCVANQSDATIASLNAVGNNVQWYSSAFNGSPLPLSTLLTSSTIYYAGQTNPDTGCLTSRLPVFVVVNVVTVPSGQSAQFFCDEVDNPPTISDLVASGTNNWYLTATSALVLSPSTPLIHGQTYYGTTLSPPCESSQRLEVLVNLVPENEAGEDGSFNICESDLLTSADVNLFEELEGLPSDMGIWTGPIELTNGNLGTLNLANLSPDGSPYVFTYTVDNSIPCPAASATVTITVIANVDAGIDGIVTFCESDAPTDLFTALGGNPDSGGTWSPLLASGTGLFDPAVDLAGVYTYNIEGLELCPSDSATVTVSITENVDAGISSSATFCESDPPIDLFTMLEGTPDLGGQWSPELASGTGVFNPSVDLAGVYTYTIEGIDPCTSSFATVTVGVIENLNAGISGNAIFCDSDSPTDLFSFLGGNPDLNGIWSPELLSGTGIFDPSTDLAGVYTYTLEGAASCPSDSATITVSIFDNLNAGTSGELTICENDSPVDLFSLLGGNPDVGGIWSPVLTSGTGLFNPAIDVDGIYTYTLEGSPSCPSVTATVNVSIIQNLSAGISGSVTFCKNEGLTDLFTLLGGNPDLGGIWSPALNSGDGFFDPAIDVAGVYTYTLDGTVSCSADFSTVTVTLDDIADAGENGIYSICETELPTTADVNLFENLLGAPSNLGAWTGPVSITNGNLGTLNISSLSLSGSPYVFTYTVVSLNSCPTAQATVTVIIEPSNNAGTDGTATFCNSASPTNLINFLGGNPSPGGTWTPALASGSGIFNPSIDLAGVYTYTLDGTSSCPSDSATVTVTLVEGVNSGVSGTVTLCKSDPITDLFTILGGNPNAGGVWSPALTSGTGIFDPSIDVPGVYTYTLIGTSPCPTVLSTVTVVVDDIPSNALANINLGTVCLNSQSTIVITNATNLANGNYILSYTISGQINSNATIAVVFQNGSTSFTIPASVFNVLGTSTITINPIQSNLANACGVSGNLFNAATFTIENIQTPVFTGTNEFCEADNPTIANLSSGITGTQNSIWYDAPTGGNAYANTTSLNNGTTYYAALVSASGCESITRLEITASIRNCDLDEIVIPDGFSPNGDGINDAFVIKNIRTLFPNFTIEIYNRWGNKLFRGNANQPDWDGSNKNGIKIGGNEVPVGVYFFIINFNDGVKKDIQGRVYLSR